MFIDPTKGREVWVVSGARLHERPDVGALGAGDISRAKAHWLRRDLLAWPGRAPAGSVFQLHAAAGQLKPAATGVTGGEALALDHRSGRVARRRAGGRPQVAGMTALRLSAADAARVPALLRGRWWCRCRGPMAACAIPAASSWPACWMTSLLTARSASWAGGVPVRVWAPTAQSAGGSAACRSHHLHSRRWSGGRRLERHRHSDCRGMSIASRSRFSCATGKVETNLVTDPYSRALSTNSQASTFVDLADPATAPPGWATLALPPLAAPEDITISELHVRDFSALDPAVPAAQRGTYSAFTLDTPGTRHLKSMARAGLTHVHLQPVFDIATIDESAASGRTRATGALPPIPSSSRPPWPPCDADGYNWGYDPWHFGVPEGSYAVQPEGVARVQEFRGMVQALAGMGLSTVVDVVYNHTNSSGQSRTSVFDRIVPGYYHRLSADGGVETSTCCENTASENRMMEKFIVDDVVHWARDYKIRGFRFDLMGHHMKRNMEKVRDALAALTLEKDGIDGAPSTCTARMGFRQVEKGKRGVNATLKEHGRHRHRHVQRPHPRRDRGGNPFGDRRGRLRHRALR
jgi:hypothetical protein